MSNFETYVAIIKGYCGMSILICPKAYQNGGFIFSPLIQILSATFTTICVSKLIKVANKKKIYSYGQLVETSFGKKARNILDFMIVMT